MMTMTKKFFAVGTTGELIGGYETREEAEAANAAHDAGAGMLSAYSVEEAGENEIVEIEPNLGECPEGEYDAELALLEECYTACEGETRYTVTVRRARKGEAGGQTYLRKADGNLQILGFSVPVPEDLSELKTAAFDRYCDLSRSAR